MKLCCARLFKLLVMVAALAGMSVAGLGAPQIIKVFLQGGQSNSDGRAVASGLPATLQAVQSDVTFYYYLAAGATNGDGTLGTLTTLRTGCAAIGNGTTFGPEITFGRTWADFLAQTNQISTNTVMVALIKYARGGTSLATNWTANGNATTNGDGADYIIFQKVVGDGLARLRSAYPSAAIQLEGMTWVQGEADILGGSSSALPYGTNLVRFIRDVRLTFGTNQPYPTNLPFVFSRISANQENYLTNNNSNLPNYLLVRAGQAYAATNLPAVYMVDIDGPEFSTLSPFVSPGLHFDAGGQQALGKALANTLIVHQPPPHFSLALMPDDIFRVNLIGIPGLAYSIQSAASVSGGWTLWTNALIGVTQATNLDYPISGQHFFRVTQP